MERLPAARFPRDSSFPRRREGGFTSEVQQIMAENLCWGLVVKTLSRSVIIGTNQREQAMVRESRQVGFSRQPASHAADGVFNAAFLPRRMGITEKGAHREFMKSIVVGEFGPVVEGNGTT